ANSTNILTMGAMAFVIGVLIAVFVWKSSSFAQQLAGAGVEGTLQGMALLGIRAAGMAVEKTRNQMKRGTRTAAEWAGEKLSLIHIS
ncbi:conjugal transfer protein TrbL, partial [Klebsiella pneumoniae]